MHDLIIVGGGPAGLTAGIYATRARLDVVLLEATAPGGQIMVSDLVENYPGFPGGISGGELMERMTEQVKLLELPIVSGEVASVDFSGPEKILHLTGGGKLSAKAVILATGAAHARLGVPGENRLFGRGVSFCATCDGPFYRGKTVVAVGGGDTAVQEALFLTRFAEKVYLVHRRDALRATRILQERAFANPKLEMVWDSVATGINGADGVESVSVKNVKTGKSKDIAADGCFIWVGIRPNTGFLGDALVLDKGGFIVADKHMATSAPGIFAAGDVRDTPLRQVSTAVGDAAIAAMSAEHYIEEEKS
ncbi:MAG: thioredoxin-disulfide reductase [Proteobacteria bacterium]|nr:thioredoxin-disulfide reductase [Pseudomonadota bacterium]